MPYKDPNKKKEHFRKYQQTQKYKIYDWKRKGIKFYDETLVYNRYMNATKCELCNKILTTGNKAKDRKCLDHDHLSGYVRWVCCNNCNNFLEKIDNNKLKLLLEIHRYNKIKTINI